MFNNSIYFDLETTGTSTTEDRIIQIGLMEISITGEIMKREALINPGIPIKAAASEVHGITDEMVKDAPPFKSYSKALKNIFESVDYIITFNGMRFDIPIIVEEFFRCCIHVDLSRAKFIDVMKLEAELFPRTLSATYKRYTGVELSNAHSALIDVEATNTVLMSQLIKIKNSGIESARSEEGQKSE